MGYRALNNAAGILVDNVSCRIMFSERCELHDNCDFDLFKISNSSLPFCFVLQKKTVTSTKVACTVSEFIAIKSNFEQFLKFLSKLLRVHVRVGYAVTLCLCFKTSLQRKRSLQNESSCKKLPVKIVSLHESEPLLNKLSGTFNSYVISGN